MPAEEESDHIIKNDIKCGNHKHVFFLSGSAIWRGIFLLSFLGPLEMDQMDPNRLKGLWHFFRVSEGPQIPTEQAGQDDVPSKGNLPTGRQPDTFSETIINPCEPYKTLYSYL